MTYCLLVPIILFSSDPLKVGAYTPSDACPKLPTWPMPP